MTTARRSSTVDFIVRMSPKTSSFSVSSSTVAVALGVDTDRSTRVRPKQPVAAPTHTIITNTNDGLVVRGKNQEI